MKQIIKLSFSVFILSLLIIFGCGNKNKETKTDKKEGADWWTPEMEEKRIYKENLKLMITKKIQYQIDLLENYIKQSKKAKKEKENNEGRIMAYQISISSLKELLQNILKEIK